MDSPFKFLNAYEKKDKDIFFGRDKEIKLLYDTTFKANLILVYGQSGTGKTSLIQCGLANHFRKTDWFEIFIRRQSNINTSLQREIKKKAATPIEEGATIVESLKSLYLDFLRPVYLIFDQFEELITLGSKSEQQAFFNTVAEVLKSGVSCKILIVMREEYIAYLYDFEQIVPQLFDNRIRIEPMHTANVDEVIRGSCKKFEIEIVNPDETVQEIIENNKNTKGEIQLPFLQVYLDRLYRYAAWESGEGKPVKFTLDLVKKIGKMSDVMTSFLYEQTGQITKNLRERYRGSSPEAVWQILNELVTIEGTNIPMQKESLISKLSLPKNVLNFCLTELEKARILHTTEKDTFEIAHDTLARRIGERRSFDEKAVLRAVKIVKERFAAYKDT
ncbi:MAG: ATP-binding protein, partial [Candidatus Aminicenantes bacterium]|nr:ATP-binding protein [Candidatus Aminicenantes bacterium]